VKGGTGTIFDWSIIKDLNVPIILAGGLNPENVRQAIVSTNPFAVDVSSGIEDSKHGMKDQIKMQTFVQNAKMTTMRCRI